MLDKGISRPPLLGSGAAGSYPKSEFVSDTSPSVSVPKVEMG